MGAKAIKSDKRPYPMVEIGKGGKFIPPCPEVPGLIRWAVMTVLYPVSGTLGTKQNVVLHQGQRDSILSRSGAVQQAQGE